MKKCKECGADEDETYLFKCPICLQMVCEEHKSVRSGRVFCSPHCAAGFFHDDDEEGDHE